MVQLAGTAMALPWRGIQRASAEERIFRHGVTNIGTLKYDKDFQRWDYVNPEAPKGGRLRLGTTSSFDTLNPYTMAGDPAVIIGVAVVTANETLMESSLDEPRSAYGLLAESLWYPDDFSEVVFRLRPAARFHDGEPVKPEDVIFGFESTKANSTNAAAIYKDVASATKTGDNEVTFRFSVKGNREMPLIMGGVAALPKHWWTAKDKAGLQRDVSKSTLEPPLGSGPYQIVDVKPASSLLLRRVKDYWGNKLPNSAGCYNFDEIEVQYFRDRDVLLEAFKGNQFDIMLESSSKQWATGYDFAAIRDGRARKEALAKSDIANMQAWALNTRKAKFQDVRVRKALDLAFDFEWSNTNLFYGSYTRCRSYFNNSELEAKGLPGPGELALLEPLRANLPPEVFTTEFASPRNDTPAARRKNLRMAQQLLAEAGWNAVEDGQRRVLKNAAGEVFTISISLDTPTFERIALPYKEELTKLGFDISVRVVDDAQYERIRETFDFDVIVGVWPQDMTPGTDQRTFFGSEFADRAGSLNYCGIKNPVVDSLIEKVVLAPDRPALINACKALDRVLMWNHYVVPMWYKAEDWVASWARVNHPANMPGYALGYSPDIWWFDEKAAAETTTD
jgi:microcin C transport system substrate-binding protein